MQDKNEGTEAPDRRSLLWGLPARGSWRTVLTVAACTAVCFAMHPFFDLPNLIMVYLLGSIYIAIRCGLTQALLSCLLGVLAFDFFFVPPHFGMTVSDTQYLFTVATMFVVAVVISRLTTHIRSQAESARAREQRAQVMLTLTRELAAARGTEKLLGIAAEQIARLYGFRARTFLTAETCGSEGCLDGEGTGGGDQEAVRWVLANNQPAGLGAGSMPELGALYAPLAGLSGTLGVLAVWPRAAGELFTAEEMHMIENLARQLGLMLEVERLEAERQRAQLEAETERLKTSLLSSVTHDFQTPLAVIMGSAESLTTVGEDLGAEQRKRLAENIRDRAGRLSRLIGNLLRVTKIESGALKPDFQLQPVEEPLGTALSLLEKQLEGRPLAVDIPGDLPLLALDGMLMEQLFLNLLENVLKYTPDGSPVEIRATADGRNLALSVADRGPGLAEEELDKVFNLFYQGSAAAGHTRKGHGIGLSVCRAIAQVHGGGIRAENREGGGAVFRITLPVPPDACLAETCLADACLADACRTDAHTDGDAEREEQ
jgi:Osmosensitive K+ channel histidine kinase